MITRIFLTSFLMAFCFSLMSQEKVNDVQSVIATIENYFYGYVERDIDKLYVAFDTQNGTMKVPKMTKDGGESFQNNYFKDILPKWGSRDKLSAEEINQCFLTIMSLDVVDAEMAVSKIKMQVGDKTYIDVLSLQKLNGLWKITNKMYITK